MVPSRIGGRTLGGLQNRPYRNESASNARRPKKRVIRSRRQLIWRLKRDGWLRCNDGRLYKQVGPTMQRIEINGTTLNRSYRFRWQSRWTRMYTIPTDRVRDDGRIPAGLNWR